MSRIVALAACLAALAAVAGCGSSSGSKTSSSTTAGKTTASADLSGQTLTFVNYGGDSMTAAEKGWLQPFTAQTGVQFKTDQPTDPAKLQAMVQAGQTTWDDVDIESSAGASMCRAGLLRTRAEMGVDIRAVPSKYVGDACGVPVMQQVVGLIYNKAKFKNNPPTRLSDFLDTKDFPGQRVMVNYFAGGLEPLAMADGVPPSQIYPYKYAQAQDAYNKIKGQLTLQNDLAQHTQALESGNYAMCICYFGRAAVAAQRGAPAMGIVWDHVWVVWDAIYAPKGSKHPDAQAAFMRFMATPAGQAGYTRYVAYGPMTPASKPDIPAAFKPFLLAGHESETNGEGIVDPEYTGKYANEANQKWTAMTSG